MRLREFGSIILLFTNVAVGAVEPRHAAMEWNERGVAAAARGDMVEAQKDYQSALAIWRTLGPDFEAHAGTTLYNLGQCLAGQGKWRETVAPFEEAVQLDRKSLGEKDARTLSALNALGRAYMITGQFDRSSASFNDALAIARQLFPGRIELAETLGNLAVLRTREARMDDALPFGEEALTVAIQVGGEQSVDTATMYSIVAEIHQQAGRPERALPLFRKARAIYDRTIAPTDLRYTALLTSEALALIDDGRLPLAEKDLKQAIQLLTPCAAECRFALAIAESNFGLLRMAQKRYNDADTYLRSALAREEQYSISDGGDLLLTMKLLAQLRDKQHRYAESAALRRRIAVAQSSYL